MKTSFLAFATLAFSLSAFAQGAIEVSSGSSPSTNASAGAAKKADTLVTEAQPNETGSVRAPSPKILDPNRQGYFQLGIGPAYGAGMQTDSLMYDINASYNFNVSDHWTLKAIGDISLASGSVSSRFFNFGVGGEFYFPDVTLLTASPYLGADVGIGFARNAIEQTATGAALGVAAGVRFQAANVNYDINAHFEQLTAEAGDSAPSVVALRGAVTF